MKKLRFYCLFRNKNDEYPDGSNQFSSQHWNYFEKSKTLDFYSIQVENGMNLQGKTYSKVVTFQSQSSLSAVHAHFKSHRDVMISVAELLYRRLWLHPILSSFSSPSSWKWFNECFVVDFRLNVQNAML